MITKSELRKKYKILSDDLPAHQVDDLTLSIANQLLKLDIWHCTFCHVFLTIEEKKEINTDYILNILSGKDKNIVISKSSFTTGLMTHFLLTDNTLIKKNSYNIPEPIDGIEISTKKLEVVFVTLLAFDKLGNRVGYGKGFYDRFLSACKQDTIKIGLSFFEAETALINNSENDVRLDYCITPKQVYSF